MGPLSHQSRNPNHARSRRAHADTKVLLRTVQNWTAIDLSESSDFKSSEGFEPRASRGVPVLKLPRDGVAARACQSKTVFYLRVNATYLALTPATKSC